MNHFRYSLFSKSLSKLNKFCNSSDPNIRNSVLVCNTLKRLERQLRKENIWLHLNQQGLAFVKLKNKNKNPEQLDYSKLILDETSQIYIEKNDRENEDSDLEEEDEMNDQLDKYGIDTNLDFNIVKQNENSSSSSSSDSESDESDQLSDELSSSDDLNTSELNEKDKQLDQISINSTVINTTTTLCNINELNSELSSYLSVSSNLLVNNSFTK